ncbi:GntR family transcriptional regulator [Nonomuraea rubra]|uniref:DNA-binding GntR family transcriptional regulator n=1 Tax=Nonomuraea rubra TaxID=46180 RepID=A0A7X0P6C5_9ACTN|nr:GntR family transcriptional regulator [Nonomuraea rubra]MBB6556090.1 DNA-binding GntR family transcriptional regulator [Nonomuraea rubra]
MEIDHDGRKPLKYQLADLLREQIMSGELAPDRAIPSEQQLMQRYELGRDTVRAGVAILKEEGYLVAERGRGTFVRPREEWPAQ